MNVVSNKYIQNSFQTPSNDSKTWARKVEKSCIIFYSSGKDILTTDELEWIIQKVCTRIYFHWHFEFSSLKINEKVSFMKVNWTEQSQQQSAKYSETRKTKTRIDRSAWTESFWAAMHVANKNGHSLCIEHWFGHQHFDRINCVDRQLNWW